MVFIPKYFDGIGAEGTTTPQSIAGTHLQRDLTLLSDYIAITEDTCDVNVERLVEALAAEDDVTPEIVRTFITIVESTEGVRGEITQIVDALESRLGRIQANYSDEAVRAVQQILDAGKASSVDNHDVTHYENPEAAAALMNKAREEMRELNLAIVQIDAFRASFEAALDAARTDDGTVLESTTE
jgi:hypothetical protein